MIKYVDPIPPILRFFKDRTDYHIDANTFQSNISEGLLVRSAGGIGFSRIQLIYRASEESEAMNKLINCVNLLEAQAAFIQGLRVEWCEKEGNPIPSRDEDTDKPEAWCYMRLEHLEA